MAIAFSDHAVVHSTLRSDTAANLLADLDSVLTSVGWSGVSITGGTKYTITSPQGYTAKVKVWDAGDPGRIRIQFLSTDETLSGYVHHLLYNVSQVENIGYEIVAHKCQLWIALIGITTQLVLVGTQDYAVAGGIPFVPAPTNADCIASAGGDTTTQIWWSSGAGSDSSHFRMNRVASGGYSYCLNSTVYVSGASGVDDGYTTGLRIFPLTESANVDVWYAALPRTVKYGTGDTLFTEPLIGWGGQIRGQLWDAVCATKGDILDTIVTSTRLDSGGNSVGLDWIVWSESVPTRGGGGTYYAALYLLTLTANQVANYAY